MLFNKTSMTVLVIMLFAYLSGCNGMEENTTERPKSNTILGYQPSGSSKACKKAIDQAYYQLIHVKRYSKLKNMRFDWGHVYDSLANALSAQQHFDYDRCVAHANRVTSYIEREINYMSWKESLRP